MSTKQRPIGQRKLSAALQKASDVVTQVVDETPPKAPKGAAFVRQSDAEATEVARYVDLAAMTLTRLQLLLQERDQVDANIDHTVGHLRKEFDCPWSVIADVTGMTRQGARKRWGATVSGSTDVGSQS